MNEQKLVCFDISQGQFEYDKIGSKDMKKTYETKVIST